jgi:hypothetical protein
MQMKMGRQGNRRQPIIAGHLQAPIFEMADGWNSGYGKSQINKKLLKKGQPLTMVINHLSGITL